MQANAWLNRMSTGILFPLVLWWRSIFSSPLIDFLRLKWTSKQLKHFMVDSRYRLAKHQLCWFYLKIQLTWLFSASSWSPLFLHCPPESLYFHILQKAFLRSMPPPVSVSLTVPRPVCSPFYGHLHQLANRSAWQFSTAVWPRMVRSRFEGIPLWKIIAARKKH